MPLRGGTSCSEGLLGKLEGVAGPGGRERAEDWEGPSRPNNFPALRAVAGRTVLGATRGVSLSSGPQSRVGPCSSAEGAVLTSPRSVATEVWHPK